RWVAETSGDFRFQDQVEVAERCADSLAPPEELASTYAVLRGLQRRLRSVWSDPLGHNLIAPAESATQPNAFEGVREILFAEGLLARPAAIPQPARLPLPPSKVTKK